jgi:hypothetical protein
LHAHGFALSGGHHPQGVGGACASTVHAWGVGSALPSEKHASFMQHMLLFSVFFRPDHSSKVDIFGTRRTFFFCVVHVTFALLYTTRKYALRTANILGRLPKYRFAVLNPCWCIERTYRLYRRGNLLEYQTVIAPMSLVIDSPFVSAAFPDGRPRAPHVPVTRPPFWRSVAALLNSAQP